MNFRENLFQNVTRVSQKWRSTLVFRLEHFSVEMLCVSNQRPIVREKTLFPFALGRTILFHFSRFAFFPKAKHSNLKFQIIEYLFI